jgi:predicted HicB family RNase H-like nuclease
VHFSSEDNAFFGKILGIDDLVNFEGASVKELKKAFHGAVDDYLETCKEIGKGPNKTNKELKYT